MILLEKWLQYLGDGVHLGTMSLLLIHIWYTKSCSGFSGKTQILLALVFTSRYVDLFIRFVSLYNTLMKIMYMAITYVTVLSIYFKFKETNSSKMDTFRTEILIVAAVIFGLSFNYELTTVEVLWAFSEYLEAVAIIPQLYLMYKEEETHKSVELYILGLFCYRTLYFWHYLLRESLDPFAFSAALIQVLIYMASFVAMGMLHVRKWHHIKHKCHMVSDGMHCYPIEVLTSEDLPTKGIVSKV